MGSGHHETESREPLPFPSCHPVNLKAQRDPGGSPDSKQGGRRVPGVNSVAGSEAKGSPSSLCSRD